MKIGAIPPDLQAAIEQGQRAGDLSNAGAALAMMRTGYTKNRHRRILKPWTGILNDGSRAWRGRKVWLPNGCLGVIVVVRRGIAAVRWDDPNAILGARIARTQTKLLTPYRHPAAVLLGKRKAGITERKSERKAQAARENGSRPPKSGSKPRGRPRNTYSGGQLAEV